MSNIEEIPIVESEAVPEEVTEPVETIVEQEAPVTPKKKKGRPRGSTKKKEVVRELTPEPVPKPKRTPKPKPVARSSLTVANALSFVLLLVVLIL